MSRKKRVRATNPYLIELTRLLRTKARENEAPIWLDISERLSKPRRSRVGVNISTLNRHTKDGDQVVVSGKVLGAGLLDHPITVAAFAFTDQASRKIRRAKGKCLSISELLDVNPRGTNVKILG